MFSQKGEENKSFRFAKPQKVEPRKNLGEELIDQNQLRALAKFGGDEKRNKLRHDLIYLETQHLNISNLTLFPEDPRERGGGGT